VLRDLAETYQRRGDYHRAEGLYQRARALVERAFGPVDPNSATALNDLAELYRAQAITPALSRFTSKPLRSVSKHSVRNLEPPQRL